MADGVNIAKGAVAEKFRDAAANGIVLLMKANEAEGTLVDRDELNALFAEAGTTGQILPVYDPSDTVHLHRRSFLATLERLDPLEVPSHLWHSQAFAFVEAL